MSHAPPLLPSPARAAPPCPQAGGYGKVVSQVLIGLRTVKGTKQLKLDPTIYDSLQKEKVQARPWVPVGVRGARGRACQDP